MSQFDYGTIDPATKSGTDLASDLTSARSAWVTNHSGTTAPSYQSSYPGMIWINNATPTAWKVYLYDGTADISLFDINSSTQESTLTSDYLATTQLDGNDVFLDGQSQVAQVRFQDTSGYSYLKTDGTNNGKLYLDAKTSLNLAVGGTDVAILDLISGVEYLLEPNTDGGLALGSESKRLSDVYAQTAILGDPAGFDLSSWPANTGADDLVIAGDANNCGLSILTNTGAHNYIFFGDQASRIAGQIRYTHSDDSLNLISTSILSLKTASTERMKIDATGDSTFYGDVTIGNIYIDEANDFIDLGDGTVGATHNTSVITIDDNTGGAISIGVPAGGNRSIWFAGPTERDEAQFQYQETNKTLSIGTKVAGGDMVFRTEDNKTCLTLDDQQDATFSGLVTCGSDSHTPDPNSDNLVVAENAAQVGINILSSSTGNANLYFGTVAGTAGRGRIIYDNSPEEMSFYVAAGEALTINSSQDATFAGAVDITNGARYTSKATLTSAASVTWNTEEDPVAKLSIAHNVTTLTLNDAVQGRNCTLEIVQTGSFTITWPSSVKFAGGTDPDISTGTTFVSLFCYDGTNWVGAAIEDAS